MRDGAGANRVPTIVFLEDEVWSSFLQLAAAARRRGCHTIRVSDNTSRDGRVLGRLNFDESMTTQTFLSTYGTDRDCGESVVDLLCTEHTLRRMTLTLTRLGLRPEVRAALRARLAAVDKFDTLTMLHRNGVPAPAIADPARCTPEAAAARLGLPLVVKQRIGAGGRGVSVVADTAGLHALLERTDPHAIYYEQFCAGETVQYAAAFDSSGVLQEAVVRSVRNAAERHAPTCRIETVLDEQAAEIGRQVVRCVGGRGLVNVDLVRDAAGVPRVVDVNLRTWESMVALRLAGIDFVDGYLAALGVAPMTPPRSSPVIGRAIAVFPTSAFRAMERGEPARAVRSYVRESGRYFRWLGARYWLMTSWMFAVGLRAARRDRGELRRRHRQDVPRSGTSG